MNTNPFIAEESERAVLTLLIRSEEGLEKYLDDLQDSDFTNSIYRDIFKTIHKLHLLKKKIDLISVSDANDTLDAGNLADIACDLAFAFNVDQYFDNIKQASYRRQAYSAFKSANDDLCNGIPIDVVFDRIKPLVNNAGSAMSEQTSMSSVLRQSFDEITNPDRAHGYKLGVPGVDNMTFGFKPGRVYTIGARPNIGKTVFGMIAALRCALAGGRVVYIMREMQKSDIIKRMISHLGDINLNAIEGGTMNDAEMSKCIDVWGAMDKLDIHIIEEAATPEAIRDCVLELHNEKRVDMVVIDYLQRLTVKQRYASRDEAVGYISWSIKNLAMEIKVPVLLLSQLNRSAVNTRPHMGQLRESGNIEQDSDVVILLHEPDRDSIPSNRANDLRKCIDNSGKYIEMIVDKNRYGTKDIVPAMFIGHKMRYDVL